MANTATTTTTTAAAMEPDNSFSSLCTEIDRIVNSPYPVALKTLDDTLRRDKHGALFRFYAASNPCKVQRLAKEVYNAIELWPYVLGLLEQLCAEPTFRRFILQHYPTLLDSLLQKAIANYSQGLDQYHEICLLLLCEPLPDSVPLPASAEHFFVCIVKRAIKSPLATTICRVYDLLTGACQGLPSILPQDAWIQLQDELMHIVGNNKRLTDQSTSLACLGVISALAVPSGTLRRPTQSQLAHSELTTDLAWSYFSSPRAFKSLKLAVLQASLSCRSSLGFSLTQASKRLDISLNLSSVVDPKVKSEWSRTDDGKNNIHQLMSMATKEGLDLELQMRLFAILGTVVEPEKMPVEIIATADRVLLNARLRCSNFPRARDLIVLFLEGFGSQISHGAWTKLLGEMLELATYGPQKVPAAELRNMCLFSQTIEECLSQIPSLRKALSTAFSALQDEVILERFLKEVLGPTSCGTEECCNATSLEARRALGCSLASLYLGTALSSGSQMRSEMGKNSLRMLTKFQQLAGSNFSCKATTSSPRTAFNVFVDAKCSPDNIHGPRDWKERLSTYTRMDAKHQENSLIRLVGEICHDLEERCNTTEEPLRKEKEKTKKVQQEVAILLEEKDMLQDQYGKSNMHVESLERQKSEVEACLAEEQDQSGRLFSRIESLERDLRETKETAEQELRQIRESGNGKEMEFLASLRALECTAEDFEDELRESKKQNEALKQALGASEQVKQSLQADLNSADRKLAELEGNLGSLDRSFRETEAQLKQQCSLNQQVEAEMRTVQDKKEQIISELSALSEHHQALTSQSEQQRSAFQDELEKYKQQLESTVSSHELAIEELSKNAAQQEDSYNVKFRNLEAKLELAKGQNEGLQTRLEENLENLAENQREIQQLEDIVAEKEETIRELNAVQQRVAAAMATAGAGNHVRKSVHYPSKPAENQRTPVSRRRSRRLTIDPKSHSNQINQAPNPESESSPDAKPGHDRFFESASSTSGPTPKRVKQYKTSRTSGFRPPRLSTGVAKTAETQIRIPLLDVSTGRGNAYPPRPATEREAYDGKNVFDEANVEVEFGSQLFTSTPFTPGPVGKTKDDHFFEDTTADE
ncbi:hypothetical protein E2P81_ATG09698 [Venturia nashicola]|uniref:Uncharacterized protein n=1 Tax=Venturia nashicola TaxID=86259 RepID=A0A4Z1NS28_9PEZI|nr:hypothetical protein E6O75_ATG09910 [Venturia nashicola]TLD26041.1 hypothetical protein E2P81_ATG09698 [Venturia nashicola]